MSAPSLNNAMKTSWSLPLPNPQMGQEPLKSTPGYPEGDSSLAAHSPLNSGARHPSSVQDAHDRTVRDASLRDFPRVQQCVRAEELVHPDPAMIPTSRSQPLKSPKSIFRRLTTKLRFPSPPQLPPKPPQPSSSFACASQRETALRERGLLPPLRPRPDLSTQEQVQDIRHSVVIPIHDTEENRDVSAATKIKQEWEIRNRVSEDTLDEVANIHNRLKELAFSGSTSSLPLLPSDTAEPFTSSHQPTPPTIPVPVTGAAWDTPKTPGKQTDIPIASSRSRAGRPPALDLGQAKKRSLSKPRPSPTYPLPPIPVTSGDSLSPKSIPLPVSPPPTPKTPSRLREPYLVPPPLSPFSTPATSHFFTTTNTPSYPPSPHNPHPPGSPQIANTISQANVSRSSHSLLPSPSSLTFSLTDTSPSAAYTANPHIDTSASGTETASLSDASVATPSVSPSQAYTTTSTNSSMGSFTSKALPKVKPPIPGISVILESPVDRPHSAKLQSVDVIETDLSAGDNDSGAVPPRPSSDRRTSFAIFRRGDNSDAISIKSSASSQRKRNAVSSSFSNFRKSVLGPLSLTRSKTPDRQRLAPSFDASHLPPSPTLPTFLTQSVKERLSDPVLPHSKSTPALAKPRVLISAATNSALPSPPHSPRQAVSPKIHSRGSILLETYEIADEESRRLSEMAFLH